MLGSGPRMTTGVGSEGGPLALYRCPVSQCGAIHTGASEAGRGSRPRMVSASFSASMMVGALRLPLTIDGMIEASTTRRDSRPCTRALPSTTAMLSVPILHEQEIGGAHV